MLMKSFSVFMEDVATAKAEADAYKAKLSPELQVKSDQMVKQLEADPNS